MNELGKVLFGTWSCQRPFHTIAWAYLLLALFAWFFADRLIFQPPGTPYPKDHTSFKTLGEDQKKTRFIISLRHRECPPKREATTPST